ncbi:MAG: hypothetical protein JF615_02390 [Asticcacaulis sp.]|nr:hypothetical protein [Asticcacaulis sp.]
MKFRWLMLPLLLLPSVAAAQTPPPGCDTTESHQFDFWVGSWEVFPVAHPETKIADSLIEKLYSGCAVRENWMPLKGGGGGSLNAYGPGEGKWRQTWLDSSGAFADFKGGWNGTAMVIEGVWGAPGQITRMTYTPHPDGSVEQAGQTSDDGGKTWTASFDLIYRKKV